MHQNLGMSYQIIKNRDKVYVTPDQTKHVYKKVEEDSVVTVTRNKRQ